MTRGGEQLDRLEILEPQLELAPVGASDEEQRLGELREPVDLLGRSLQRRSQLRLVLAVPERELELRAQERERRPQLVAGVRDEGALAEQRGLEPGEHRVERVSEPLRPRPASAARAAARRGLSAEIAAARRRIVSTGRSASPART